MGPKGEVLFAWDRVLLASMDAGVLVMGTGTTAHLSCQDKPCHGASVPVLLAGSLESSLLLVRISVLYWVGLGTLPFLSQHASLHLAAVTGSKAYPKGSPPQLRGHPLES